ncbi:exodeoxyribonuclease VII large subunit [Candidatus Marithrix sp. Canyon 246]|uniref:exodeoxyribonuclease VII large subunit n=1 Tax=Candidatus Marithrix sp. Canyon 246 TaxID=1827136 RepID=UPI000849F746|nr:exodeoxyribonuclease VII large subunit [Candidatus Marithrix sp. Canyon 246]
MKSQEPIFLDCPFSEKDEVKRLGAKFDWQEKQWFVPVGLDLDPFSKWLSKQVDNDQPFSLYDLMLSVQSTVNTQLNDRYWVRAELVSVSHHVHLYMELSDHDNEGQELAKVRAILWNHRAKELLKRFETQTGMPFKAGMKLLLQVRVEFHTRYGFSLDVIDIDPNFTIGEMAAKLNRIRMRLQEEKLYDCNQTIKTPIEFCKVAVIAPPQAAGLGDFKSQAKGLADLCEFHYYNASFQGQQMLTEITAAFELIKQDHKEKQFDAVVMIRGGGAKADLFQLNEYEIAKAICTAPLAVIVGIGHERDQTLLDEVANKTCHTPSLVITYIASRIIQNAQNAKQDWQMLNKLVSEQLYRAKTENERLITKIHHNSQIQLNKARHNIQSFMQQILQSDPKKVLKRGYAIVKNTNNKIISSKLAAEQEPQLIIEFQDGQINLENL